MVSCKLWTNIFRCTTLTLLISSPNCSRRWPTSDSWSQRTPSWFRWSKRLNLRPPFTRFYRRSIKTCTELTDSRTWLENALQLPSWTEKVHTPLWRCGAIGFFLNEFLYRTFTNIDFEYWHFLWFCGVFFLFKLKSVLIGLYRTQNISSPFTTTTSIMLFFMCLMRANTFRSCLFHYGFGLQVHLSDI